MENDNIRDWSEWEIVENETVERLYEDSRRNLKKLREKIGVNQAEFAKALGISRAALSYYENGARVPDIKFILKVGVLTDCSFAYLLGDTPTMKRQEFDIAKALDITEEEAEQLTRACEFRPAFRALLSSRKLGDICSLLKYSAPDIISGKEDYDRIVWECMKGVEQLFREMLDASIVEAKAHWDIFDDDSDSVPDEEQTEEESSPPPTPNMFQSFRERLNREEES